MSVEEYKVLIKEKRESLFLSPYDFVYASFKDLGYEKKEKDYFRDNASSIVENLRDQCWKKFLEIEKKFTNQMLHELMDKNRVEQMNPVKAITSYIEEYSNYMYALILSNTQSRRSRVGKEFETIIELILAGANVPFNS